MFPVPSIPSTYWGVACSKPGRTSCSGAQVRIATAIFSYDGNLYVGVTGDYDTVPDIEVMCTGIDRGIAELSGAGAQSAPDASMAGSGDGAADVSGSGGDLITAAPQRPAITCDPNPTNRTARGTVTPFSNSAAMPS